MHALHLPFTGIFVGGFAILIVSLLASLPEEDEVKNTSIFSRISKATIIVLLVKAAVSPQSPPPAYIAVAFQGFTGALLFQFFPFKLAAILLGVIAMAESALQRIVIATIIYGKSLWTAIDSAFNSIVKEFHLPTDMSFSLWIIVIYAGVYALWGLMLGMWMIKLPKQIRARADLIYSYPEALEVPAVQSPKNKFRKRLLVMAVVLLFISIVFLLERENIGRAVYVVLRTIAVVALLIWVVNPAFRWLIARWVRKPGSENAQAFKDVMNFLPEVRSYLQPAYRQAAEKRSWIGKFQAFVLTLIVLTLYSPRKSGLDINTQG
jgi:hypothetical protein